MDITKLSAAMQKQLGANQAEIDAMDTGRKADQALQLRLASEAALVSAPGMALWKQFAAAYPHTALGVSVGRDLASFERTIKKMEAEATAAALEAVTAGTETKDEDIPE